MSMAALTDTSKRAADKAEQVVSKRQAHQARVAEMAAKSAQDKDKEEAAESGVGSQQG